MRKNFIKTLSIAFMAAFLMACTKDESKVVESMAGSWHYEAVEYSQDIDVYLVLSADYTFEMFQKVGEGAYWRSTGTFEINVQEKTITGTYSDRVPWKNVYEYSVGSSTLTLSAAGVSRKYVAKSVPDDVRSKCLDLTKSGGESEPVERLM